MITRHYRIVACLACLLFTLGLSGCKTEAPEKPATEVEKPTDKKPAPKGKLSDNPKSRAGKMVKSAKDVRKTLDKRNKALDKRIDTEASE